MNRIGILALVAVAVVAGAFWMGRSISPREAPEDPFAPVDIGEFREHEPMELARAAVTPPAARAPQRHVVQRDLGVADSSLRARERSDFDERPRAALARPATDDEAADDDAEVGELSDQLETGELFGAQLEDEDLRGAQLEGANLAESNLRRAQLDNANLKDADLRGADLTGANMVGTDLSGASMQGAHLAEAYIQANMRNADLRGADLRAAGLWGVHMNSADLRGANLQGATVKGDFVDADLRTADLRWANLEEANFHRANLDGAVLLGAASLTCDVLTIANNWQNSYRSPDLACGAPIPPIPPELME